MVRLYFRPQGCLFTSKRFSTGVSALPKRSVAGVLFAALLLAACMTPLKTRYYTLSAEAPPRVQSSAAMPRFHVAIGPVSVPAAIDRPQIVLSIAPNRYSISDAERWSEPLKNELPYLIARHVGQHLTAAGVSAYMQYSSQDADYRVPIDITRFESVPGKSATLAATWSVRDRTGARLRESHSVFVESVHAPGVAPLVAAHAKAVAALGNEIAQAIDALTRPTR